MVEDTRLLEIRWCFFPLAIGSMSHVDEMYISLRITIFERLLMKPEVNQNMVVLR